MPRRVDFAKTRTVCSKNREIFNGLKEVWGMVMCILCPLKFSLGVGG